MGKVIGVLLPLNAFLLRSKTNPGAALSDATGHACEFLYGHDGKWERDDWRRSAALDAAVHGDVAVALFARRRRQPAWHEFVRKAVEAPHFGGGAHSFGAAIFCAVQNSDGGTDCPVRWVVWCFGTAARMIGRAASDPRFGLTIALNLPWR